MINVLPEQQKKELRKEYLIRLVSTYFFLFGILFFLATILLLPTYIISSSKESFLENEFLLLKKENPNLSLSELENIIFDINTKLGVLDTESKNILPTKIVSDFLSIQKQNIEINKIFYIKDDKDIKSIEINGVAKDRSSLSAFKSNLEKSGLYENVDLPISNLLGKTDISFNIKMSVKNYE